MIGQTVGSYRIVDSLGQDERGALYRATHAANGSSAIIRMAPASRSADGNRVERWFADARSAAALRHACSVEVLESGLYYDGRAYLITPLFTGETLATRLAKGIEDRLGATVMAQVVSLLRAAHAKAIVHRSIAPRSVFLAKDDAAPMGVQVKLLDYGLARLDPAAATQDVRADLTATAKLVPGVLDGKRMFASADELHAALVDAGASPLRAHDPEPVFAKRADEPSHGARMVLVVVACVALAAAGSIIALMATSRGAASAPPATPRIAARDPLVAQPPRGPHVPKLTVDAVATAGAHVTIKFDGPIFSAPGEQAWVALSRKSDTDSGYAVWAFIADGATSVTLNAPSETGDYEIRIHDQYPRVSFHVIARKALTIESGLAEDPNPAPPNPAEKFTLARDRVRRGSKVALSFPAPLVASTGEQYWITIVPVGTRDSEWATWAYVVANATRASLDAPAKPGQYEMRLHGHYPAQATHVVYRLPFQVE